MMKRWVLLLLFSAVGCGPQNLPPMGHSLPAINPPQVDPQASAACRRARGVADQWMQTHPEISKTTTVNLPNAKCEVRIQVAANANLLPIYSLIKQQSGRSQAIQVQNSYVGVWMDQDMLASTNKSAAPPAATTKADCAAAQTAVQSAFPAATLALVKVQAGLLFNSACYLQMEFAVEADLESFLNTARSNYSLGGELLHANVLHKDGSVATVRLHLASKN